jgi:hypothetical protein
MSFPASIGGFVSVKDRLSKWVCFFTLLMSRMVPLEGLRSGFVFALYETYRGTRDLADVYPRSSIFSSRLIHKRGKESAIAFRKFICSRTFIDGRASRSIEAWTPST